MEALVHSAAVPRPLQIDANFGVDLARKPFKADMAAIQKEAEQRLYSRILHLQLPAGKVGTCLAGYLPAGRC